ncbi:recombinase family protein, partial [Methylobacterium jeotgali]|uniref:recombinase family protein n=1 Tax=Methylobacterium jeotgali TaxID=381630 RepID=UPI001EE1ECC9
MRRAAIYVRVSTDGQTTENQLRRLREVAQRAGWDIVATYDETASGAVGPERRTEYAAMLKDAARRKFDVLMAWDVSRLGRSLAGLVALMEQLRALKVDLFIDQQGLDTTTPWSAPLG